MGGYFMENGTMGVNFWGLYLYNDMEKCMKNYIDYVESPYFDMKQQLRFGQNLGCGCNPCQNYFPPMPKCHPPEKPPCDFSCEDKLLYFFAGFYLGKKW